MNQGTIPNIVVVNFTGSHKVISKAPTMFELMNRCEDELHYSQPINLPLEYTYSVSPSSPSNRDMRAAAAVFTAYYLHLSKNHASRDSNVDVQLSFLADKVKCSKFPQWRPFQPYLPDYTLNPEKTALTPQFLNTYGIRIIGEDVHLIYR